MGPSSSKIGNFARGRAVLTALCLLVAIGSSGMLQAADTVQVSATLRPILAVTTSQDIGFGDISVGPGLSGTLALRPDGTLIISGTGLAVGGTVPPQSGQIDIAGQAGVPIDLSCESALLANILDETVPVAINIAAQIEDAGLPCAGLATPVMTVTQPNESFSIFVGGLIDANDLASITSFEQFSSSLNAGVHAAFQAVYQ